MVAKYLDLDTAFIGTTVYSMCLFKLNEDQES